MLPATRSHAIDQEGRVIHEVEQIIKPAAADRPPPIGAAWSASPIPPRRRDRRQASAAAPVFTGASSDIDSHPSFSLPLPPFPMWPAFPASDYYGGSAPSRPHRSTANPAHPPQLAAREWAGPGWFPRSLLIRSTGEAPSFAPAASPRLRRRPSPRPPGPSTCKPSEEFPTRRRRRGTGRCAPHPAQIRQIRAGRHIKRLTTPVPRVHLSVSLAGPGPSGSAGPPRLCQGCSHPPRRPPGQAAPSFIPLLRQGSSEGLSPPFDQQAPHGALLRWQTRVGQRPNCTWESS